MSGRKRPVLIAHARGDEDQAACLAVPLAQAGYDIEYQGTLLVGDSVAEQASRFLAGGGPVVLCGSVRALGTRWARRVVNAAQVNSGCLVLPVRMEEDADVEALALDCRVAEYWRDPDRAVRELCAALTRCFPGPAVAPAQSEPDGLENDYRARLQANYDVYDLDAGLPNWNQRLVTEKPLLRRLYVPLRVVVESPHGTGLGLERLSALQFERERQRGTWSTPEASNRRERVPVPVGERLAASRRLVVLGDPGSGKSTLLKWITTAYLLRLAHHPDWRDLPDVRTLPDADWLPVLVRCRDLDHDQARLPFEDILRHALRKLGVRTTVADATLDLLLDRLAAGRALLLVDGIDEIGDPRARIAFCEQVERTHLSYPEAMIVVTSRIVGYREMSRPIRQGFEHVTVAELTREDRDEFARRWCAAVAPPARAETEAEELIRSIHSTERIERLTGNPLLLTTMALVWRSLRRLPQRRGELYERAIDCLLNWRSDVGEPLTRDEALPQMEYVAFAMCKRGTPQIRLDELVELCTRMREEFPNVHAVRNHHPDEFIRLVEERTGLLSEVGHERHRGRSVPVFEFRHLTFQEYLAGVALVRGDFPGHVRDRDVADVVSALAAPVRTQRAGEEPRMAVAESWREPIRLCLTACNSSEADPVLEAVLTPAAGEAPELTGRPRAVLAALCLADEPDTSSEMARRVVRALVAVADEREFPRHPPSDLNSAADELARSRWRDQLLDTLIEEYLSLPSLRRRPVGAVYGHVATRNWSSSEAVARAAEMGERLDEEDPRLAVEAALCVGSTSDLWQFSAAYRAAGISTRIVRHCAGNTLVADAAAWALTDISRGPLSPRWGPMWVGIRSKWFLTEMDLNALDHLLESGDHLPDGVLLSLYGIVHRLGSGSAIARARNTAAHPDARLRAASLLVLGALEDRASIPLLVRALAGDADPRVRSAAARAIGWLNDPTLAHALGAALTDANESVRANAAEALGFIDDSACAEWLRDGLRDPAASVRASAVEALGWWGRPADEATEAAIADALRDTCPEVRRKAAGTAGSLKSSASVDRLLECIDDEDADTRERAIYALMGSGDLSEDRAGEAVERHLTDDDASVRRQATQAAKYMQSDAMPGRLRERLLHEQGSVREASLTSLAWLGAAVSDEQLSALLRSDDIDVSGAAIDVMVAMSRNDVRERVIDACEQSPSRKLFLAAAGLHVSYPPPGVEKVGHSGLHAVLSRYRSSSDADLRAGAVMALSVLSGGAIGLELAPLADSNIGDVEYDVVRCIRHMTGPDAVATLSSLARLQSEWIRGEVVWRLKELRRPDGVTLAAQLLFDRDSWVRRGAIWTLHEVRESIDVLDLLLSALNDPIASVRKTAIWTLGDYGQDAATDALIPHVRDMNPAIRSAVLSSLGGRSPEVVTPLLLNGLDEPYSAVREAAASALGRTPQEAQVTERFVALLRRSDPADRATALRALPLRHDRDLCELVLPHLDDEDERVRRQALRALDAGGHPAAVARWRAQLADASRPVRQRAFEHLIEERDAVDRWLVSRDLTTSWGARDPRWPVTMGQVRLAAWRLGRPVEYVRRRYEILSTEFGLPLTW